MEHFLDGVPEWHSDDKILALFAQLPEQSENPELFSRKYLFWHSLILNAARKCLLGHSPFYIDPATVGVKFCRRGALPLGIHSVLKEMERSGDLVDYERFISFGNWTTWFYGPLSWPSMLLSSLITAPKGARRLLITSLVNDSAMELLSGIRNAANSLSDLIRDVEDLEEFTFESSLDKISLKSSDLVLLIDYLSKKGLVSWIDSRDKRSVRFSKTDFENSSISDADRGVVKVQRAIKRVELQISELDAKICRIRESTAHYNSQKDRMSTLHYIKMRKIVEQALFKRQRHLELLRTVMQRIDDSESEIEIIAAFSASAKALRTLTAESTAADAEKTLDEMLDAMQDQAEIQRIIDSGTEAILGSTGEQISDADLEIELEGLISNQAKSEVLGRRGTDVGDVNLLIKELGTLAVIDKEFSSTLNQILPQNSPQALPS